MANRVLPERRRGWAAPIVGALLLLALTPLAAVAAPTITGCPVFPADNVWNTDISSLPVSSSSSAWLSNMGGAGRLLHPDFGSSGDPSAPYGIPYTVVDASHPRVSVSFTYGSESDNVPYPLGPDTPIEGGQNASGDRHALMVDRTACVLYELFDAHYSASGSTAGSGAVFQLGANGPLRPAGWTSADAAGLPIFPGLLRPDEVRAGSVNHAIRFTAQLTDKMFIWPARHQAGSARNPAYPPMGARFRLRAGFDVSHYRADTQVVLTAMKRYGLILADNGSNWFFQGAADNSWDSTMISELKSVPAGAFDAVDESSLMIDPNSGQARQPSGAGTNSPGGAGAGTAPGSTGVPGDAGTAQAPAAAAATDPVSTWLERHPKELSETFVPAGDVVRGGPVAARAPAVQWRPPLWASLMSAAAAAVTAAASGAWLLRSRASPG